MNSITYTLITKAQARKLFHSGYTIYTLPNNLNPYNKWVTPYAFDKTTTEDFDQFLNSYSYYNCNSETGRSLRFYKEVIYAGN